jgi:hypothetical protein
LTIWQIEQYQWSFVNRKLITFCPRFLE